MMSRRPRVYRCVPRLTCGRASASDGDGSGAGAAHGGVAQADVTHLLSSTVLTLVAVARGLSLMVCERTPTAPVG